MKKIVSLFVFVAILATSCGPVNTPVAAIKPGETPSPKVSTLTPATIPTPPVTGTPTPISYHEYQVDGGPVVKVWGLKDEKVLDIGPIALTLVLVDGPLPVGDIIALVLIAGTCYYLTVVYADEIAGTLENLPKIPPIDWPGIKHAAKSRGWPIMFTMIVYAEVYTSPNEVFYGPTSDRLLVVKYIEGWGVIGLVFSTEKGLFPDAEHLPIGNGLVTIIYNSRGRVDQIRMSDCASWQIMPVIGYNPIFEPPPVGAGRCLTNNNTR